MAQEQPAQPDSVLLVVRCRRCGDTFPLDAGAGVVCPACAAEDQADEAGEPLL